MLRKLVIFMTTAMLLCCTACKGEPASPVAAEHSVTYITDTVKITDEHTIAAGEDIHVRSGGVLYIDADAILRVEGSLNVADGGELYVRGSAVVAESGTVSISGKAKILSSGSIDLDGMLRVNQTGVVKGEGSVLVNGLFSDIQCSGTVTARLQPPEPVKLDGVTYVGGVLLVNKDHSIPDSYGDGITPEAYSAYVRMKNASGYGMSIISGYRSYEQQVETFEKWCELDGYDEARYYSAKPGHSEHQTGLALDITSLEQSYGDTDEGRWLAANCHKYGFIIRYPEDKSEIMGYIYEPWHIRYLGESTAKLVHDSGLTLEEFLGVA